MVDALQFAGGKFHCPVTLYAAHPEASRTLVILPALGVTARKYAGLAQRLVAAGHNVLVADWPGQGESQPRPGWRFNYGYRQLVEEFLPKLLQLARRHFPQAVRPRAAGAQPRRPYRHPLCRRQPGQPGGGDRRGLRQYPLPPLAGTESLADPECGAAVRAARQPARSSARTAPWLWWP